jgi:hypothetical protein
MSRATALRASVTASLAICRCLSTRCQCWYDASRDPRLAQRDDERRLRQCDGARVCVDPATGRLETPAGPAGPVEVGFDAPVSSTCVASIVIQPLAAKTNAGPLDQVLSFIHATSQPGAIVPAAVTSSPRDTEPHRTVLGRSVSHPRRPAATPTSERSKSRRPHQPGRASTCLPTRRRRAPPESRAAPSSPPRSLKFSARPPSTPWSSRPASRRRK